MTKTARKKAPPAPPPVYVAPVFLPDATDFTDLPLREPNDGRTVLCPVCKGHGRWNLQLNVYGPGKHFQASCSQCWGWGWVVQGGPSETCIHTFVAIAPDQPFRCWHTDRCTSCGHTVSYSSDD